ncbi:MAG: Crp/Fnr family transcriptional regulator [Bacteroidota bacterium]
MISVYLESYQILTEEDINAFLDLVKVRSLKKGEFFITEGNTSKHIAYIQSGIFRSFYHSTSQEEVTYCFTFQNTLITAYSSWITQQPTNENIQALTDMELVLISYKDMEKLDVSHPNWIKFFKRIAELEYINLEKRIFMLQRESAETRYQSLLQHHPEYLHHIPLHYLASYLGVTQRHLSRIRKNFAF